MYSIAYQFAFGKLAPKAGKLPNVYVTAKTKYGSLRVRITEQHWHRANSLAPGITAPPGSEVAKSRSHIAIKVRTRLNMTGAQVYWLKWDEIAFGPVSSQKEPENPIQPQPSPLALHNARVAELVEVAEAMASEDDLQAVAELFPEAFGLTPPAPRFDACGCTPHPVTAM